MTALTLAESLMRHSIGMDQMLSRFADPATSSNYPPHNIEQITDDHYRLTIAVAGFGKHELEVSLFNGDLTVLGRKDTDKVRTFLYRGLAFRDFTRVFKLGEHVEVQEVCLRDGLLIIDLMRHLPDSAKPKLLLISD